MKHTLSMRYIKRSWEPPEVHQSQEQHLLSNMGARLLLDMPLETTCFILLTRREEPLKAAPFLPEGETETVVIFEVVYEPKGDRA